MAIAAVSSQNGIQGAGANSDTYAYGSNVSAGSLITIVGGQRDFNTVSDAFVAGDVTQSAGTAVLGTISLDAATEFETSEEPWIRIGIWSAIVTTGGSLTMQLGANGSDADTMIAGHEFTGSWDGTRVEDTSTTTDDTNNVDPTTGNATSVGAALFIAGFMAASPNAISPTEDAAFSLIGEINIAPGDGNAGGSAIYRIVSSGTTDAGDWTMGNSIGRSSALVVYKEAAGGAANPKGPLGMPLHGPFGGPL